MGRGGHHPARVGDTLKGGRYRILARLGSGHFSTVWLCYDSQARPRAPPASSALGPALEPTVATAVASDMSGRAVAVKIQKSTQRYTDAAHDEIMLLRDVRREDPHGNQPVVSLLDSFAHSGPNGRHMCLVFDVMGPSLLSLIKRFRYRGVPLPLVRTLAYNLLRGLRFLHEGPAIVHTDIKPENILMWPSSEDYLVLHREAARFSRHLVAQKCRRIRSTPPAHRCGPPAARSAATACASASTAEPALSGASASAPASASVSAPASASVSAPASASVSAPASASVSASASASVSLPAYAPAPSSTPAPSATATALYSVPSTSAARPICASVGEQIAAAQPGSSETSIGLCLQGPGSSSPVVAPGVAHVPSQPDSVCDTDPESKVLTKNQRKRMKAKARKAKRKLHAHVPCAGDEVDIMVRDEELKLPLPSPVPTSTLSQSSSHSSASLGSGEEEEPSCAAVDRTTLSDGLVEGCTIEDAKPERCGVGPGENDVEPDLKPASAGSSGICSLPAGAAPCSVGADAAVAPEYSETAFATSDKFSVGSLLVDDDLFRRGEVCIIDLGNACWASGTTTGVIQTRQYRSPEVITGGRFGPSADLWSAGCLLFELATGEFLFDPHSGRDYDRDEDHLAQMIELLGPVPREVSFRGAYAHELFNRRGELRHIRELSFWSLEQVLREKYNFIREDAALFADFLRQMLRFDPKERLSAAECMEHEFLTCDRFIHAM